MTAWHGFSDERWAPIWRVLAPRFIDPDEEEASVRQAIEGAIQNAVHFGTLHREWRLEQAKRERMAEATGERIEHAGLGHRKGRPPRDEMRYAVGAVSQVLRDIGVPLRVPSGRGTSNNTDVVRVCILAIMAAASALHPPREDLSQAVCDWLDRWHAEEVAFLRRVGSARHLDRSLMMGILGEQY